MAIREVGMCVKRVKKQKKNNKSDQVKGCGSCEDRVKMKNDKTQTEKKKDEERTLVRMWGKRRQDRRDMIRARTERRRGALVLCGIKH